MVGHRLRRTKGAMSMRVIMCTILLVATCFAVGAAEPIRPVAGPVILARSGVQATYLWDATPYVAQLVSEKDVGDTGLRALLGTAASVLRQKAPSSHAKTMTLRIVYTRSGDVSPVYGTLTFNGVEKVATLIASRDAILKHGAAWAQELAAGKKTPDLKVEITGKLPPAQ
jgi:hypothetical protein